MTVYQDATNAIVGTAAAELATVPLCTVKTNYQNGGTMTMSARDVAKQMYLRGGFRAFYAASLPAIVGQVFSTTSKWTLYRFFQDHVAIFPREYVSANTMANGVASGVLTTLITHPMDVVKIHWQMGVSYPRNSLYRGYSKTFTKVALASSLFFPLNDIFKRSLSESGMSLSQQTMWASSGAAVVSTIVMHPVDYLKTRHIFGQPFCHGWNIFAYYRGLAINLARIVPHFCITMTVIDWMERHRLDTVIVTKPVAH